ncbi:signal peptide peptidase-like 2A isoform X2 [Brienomyrus brachyistius]|uniref:signal peptide peptidase-like 2A isoform X2 n=1 Tax=Brienomyrus brachyistius TaxID=42636 RepID=UPI0020B2751C|nr:signal peptide peptidase-like 2A isoform X2 [Brienomyrus brachyistius]
MARKLTIFICAFFAFLPVNCQEGILHVSGGSQEKEYCLVYNSSFSNISASLNDAIKYQLVNLSSSFLCNSSGIQPNELKGKAVVVMRDSCTFSQKAQVAQDLGATTILIASNKALVTPFINDTEYGQVKIPVALMRYRDMEDAFKTFGDNMSVRLYAPPTPVFDFSILAILFISMFTVGMGAFWSGAVEREKLNTAPMGGDSRERTDSGDLPLYSPLKVILFVAFMCVVLVLMYFFYAYLVYVTIVIFCIASATALYSCFDAIMEKLGCATLSFSCLGKGWSGRSLLLASLCITVAVLWGVYRNEDRWIWILQDLLGIAFCLNFMKTITVSNFKICVILLSLLLIYDVFFVFITPFLTKDGQSIMVEVALGPGSVAEKSGGKMVTVPAVPTAPYEKLPLVMRVPRFLAPNLCMMQFSILGYGDIIVPGLLVAYCHRFDVWTSSPKRIYFMSCTIAYFLGMVVTFVVMILSQMGQPALLYLVPFTLLTSAAVAWRRGEMKRFWSGTAYEVLDTSREPLLQDGRSEHDSNGRKC